MVVEPFAELLKPSVTLTFTDSLFLKAFLPAPGEATFALTDALLASALSVFTAGPS
jgi:hypothetical protein